METTLEETTVTSGQFHGVERFEIGLSFLPNPDFLEYSIPSSHHSLITNDGSALSRQLVEELKSKGNKVVVLNLPAVPNPIAENALSLSAYTDEAVGELIRKIQHQYGKTGSFIHIHPHFEFQHGNFTQHFTAERDIVKAVFFIAK
ncbi:MAG: hypothetical protein AAF696_20735, partial [Bacteroidota bacterium]